MFCLQQTEAEIVMSDLEKNLEREKDLEKQLKCSREERDVLNDAWYKLYKENQNLAIYQTDWQPKVIIKGEHILWLQMQLAVAEGRQSSVLNTLSAYHC